MNDGGSEKIEDASFKRLEDWTAGVRVYISILIRRSYSVPRKLCSMNQLPGLLHGNIFQIATFIS
jgi:hypothetical protein